MAPVAVALAAAMVAVGSGTAAADTPRQSEWWLAKLHILQAQQISQGSGVTIAVLSTGAISTTPDIAGSVTNGPDYSNSGRSSGGPFYGIQGTEMASLIVGHGHGPDHADGILGVAPAAKILSIRVTLDSGDPQLSDSQIAAGLPTSIAKGIRYAAKTGATVIELPLDPAAESATGTHGATAIAGPSQAEKDAIAFALSKGAVLVAPAGDDGASSHAITNYPAAFNGVIAVGAFDSALNRAPFSSGLPYVKITAGGMGVTAATPSGYTTMNSTAAAAALVTGVVALVRSDFPALSVKQVTRALTSSTQFHHPGGTVPGSGFGVVDAMAALKKATLMAEPKGQAAGANAVPRMVPMAPAVTSTRATLAHKIERDALLSLAVLVALLALVGLIVLARRYRPGSRRGAGQSPPQPAERPLLASVGAGSQPPPDFLPAPGTAAGPGGTSYPPGFEPAFGNGAFGGSGRPGLNGDTPLNGASALGAFGPQADAAPFPPAPAAGRHSADSPGRPRQGSRSAPPRPKVSGRPPWEPALKPESELPWTAGPASPPAPVPPPPPLPASPPAARPNRPEPAGNSAWETGPASPNGANGANGPTGANGPNGSNGYWAAPVLPSDLNPTGRREFTGAQDLSPAHGVPPLPMRPPAEPPEADGTDVFPAYPAESYWPTDR
jgi:subtilase family protein